MSSGDASPPLTPSAPQSPRSPRRRADHLFTELTPLLRGPPPAYSAATTNTSPSSISPQGPEMTRNYNTISEQHLEHGLIYPREPESMGGPVDSSERRPLIRPTSRRRTIIRNILLAALVFAIVAAILTMVFESYESDPSRSPVDGQPPSGDPEPQKPKVPSHKPDKGQPPEFEIPVDGGKTYCKAATFQKKELKYQFPIDTTQAIISQTTYEADGTAAVETYGEIRLRRLPKDSAYGDNGYFTLNVKVSDRDLDIQVGWDADSRSLEVSTPMNGRTSACISLEITAWLPENAELSELSVSAVTLTLRVFENIKLYVLGESRLSTLSGQVYFGQTSGKSAFLPDVKFLSRRTIIETLSGSINGRYELLDYLSMSSKSGSVRVSVTPQPILESAPAPAVLEISTLSGSIHADLPQRNSRHSVVPRDYKTHVHSISGSISGSYYLGSCAEFKTKSSGIGILILPVLADISKDDVVFDTHSISGSTEVQMEDPIYISLPSRSRRQPDQSDSPCNYDPIGDDDPSKTLLPPSEGIQASQETAKRSRKAIRNLRSSHTSTSASISVSYPSAWEGIISAKSVSGDIKVLGNGVEIIKRLDGWPRQVLARKGVEREGQGSLVKMSDAAGSLKFTVGSVV